MPWTRQPKFLIFLGISNLQKRSQTRLLAPSAMSVFCLFLPNLFH
jgi:hypothetical protein